MNPVFPEKIVIYRQVGVLAAVSLVFLGCLVILKPFIPALLLAAILCLSTWPAFKWVERKFNYRTTLAAALMTLLLAVCFVIPLVVLGSSLAESFSGLVGQISTDLQSETLIQTPNWIRDLPLVGHYIDEFWQTHASDKEQLLGTIKQYSGPVSLWLIAIGGAIGRGILDISLGVIIAFFFFHRGQFAVTRLRNLIENFGGEKSIQLMHVCANTVIGVVYGMVGTALVLGALSGLAFWIADVPGAPFLGLVTFLLSLIPFGPPLIWIPVVLWLLSEGHVQTAIFMGIGGVVIITLIDNVIRPYLISLGSKMPLLLILLGVLGGIASFGFIGLFIGPALLAIASAMVIEWSQKQTRIVGV